MTALSYSEDELIRNRTIKIRKKSNLKLPDAFIAATSIIEKVPLMTADQVFSKVSDIQFIDYEI